MYITLLLCLLFGTLTAEIPCANPVVASKPLDMSGAVELGFRFRPALKAAGYNVKAREYDAIETLTGYFPQISLNGIGATSRGLLTPFAEINVQASQLIYSFAGPLQEHGIAMQDVAIADQMRRLVAITIRIEVERAFLEYWLLQEEERFISRLNLSAESTFAREITKRKVHLSGRNVWLQAVAAYNRDKADVARYIEKLTLGRKTLERVMGIIFSPENTVVDDPNRYDIHPVLSWDFNQPIRLKELPYYIALGYQHRPELKIKKRESIKERKIGNLALGRYLPELSAFGTFISSKRPDNINLKGRSVGVLLKWNAFDGLSNFFKSRSANASRIKFIFEQEDERKQVKLEIQEAYHTLKNIMQELVGKYSDIMSDYNELQLQRQNYDIGLASLVELKAAWKEWEQSRFEWLELKVAAAILERQLYFACGYPTALVGEI